MHEPRHDCIITLIFKLPFGAAQLYRIYKTNNENDLFVSSSLINSFIFKVFQFKLVKPLEIHSNVPCPILRSWELRMKRDLYAFKYMYIKYTKSAQIYNNWPFQIVAIVVPTRRPPVWVWKLENNPVFFLQFSLPLQFQSERRKKRFRCLLLQ